MAAKRFEALRRELRRLEADFASRSMAMDSTESEDDQEFDSFLELVVGEGALPAKTEQDIEGLESILRKVTVPTQVIAQMKERWRARFVSPVQDRSFTSDSLGIAVSFRKGDKGVDEQDHKSAREAIERLRRDLRERDQKK